MLNGGMTDQFSEQSWRACSKREALYNTRNYPGIPRGTEGEPPKSSVRTATVLGKTETIHLPNMNHEPTCSVTTS
jgi:hypothetical protein